MEKKKKTLKAHSTELLVNECPGRNCVGKVKMEAFVGVDEGTNKINGKRIFIGICPSCTKEMFYVDFRLVFDPTKGYILPAEKLDGEYKIVKVD